MNVFLRIIIGLLVIAVGCYGPPLLKEYCLPDNWLELWWGIPTLILGGMFFLFGALYGGYLVFLSHFD
jgi:hypothetical protein